MDRKKKRFVIAYINIALILLLYILRASGILVLNIGQASPIILLPLIVSISMFFGEWMGAVSGFCVGLLMDTTTVGSSVFGSFSFMLIGLICGVLSSYYLNKNMKAALALSLGSSFAYFFAKYLCFYVFAGHIAEGEYFSGYLFPSAVYTALFIIPFYFLQKKLKSL